MATPEKSDKTMRKKESSCGKEHPYGQTHPAEHCKEEQGAEFNASLGTESRSNGKDSWMCSTTAGQASYWQGPSLAAFTYYVSLSPFLNTHSRPMSLEGIKPVYAWTYCVTCMRIPLFLCSQEPTDRWECCSTLQRQLHQLGR